MVGASFTLWCLLPVLGSFLLSINAGATFYFPSRGPLNTVGVRNLIVLHNHFNGGHYAIRDYKVILSTLRTTLRSHPHLALNEVINMVNP